ncbi:hypothetical protein Vadar_022366 [Vaccinium darrowii]|uniref:Uncharacterized protein n=1 Tax=Vaccinium darrowii TaxID=229202 RepID=A0ACB7XBQ5_9ERIC|nr:hypothetical protein Vadar_022366 [Vaccinium darrowii]
MEVLFPENIQGIPKPTFGGAKIVIDIDPDIVEAANFAVEKYNKTQGTHLVLQTICVAWKQFVCSAGTRYYMILHCKEGACDKICAAIVRRMFNTNEMDLELFKIIFG